jgi:AcrR family transcriptional regulator
MSQNPRQLRERFRVSVRAEIVDAAERLFLERGYEATTIEDIATQSGMSARSVYRYFPTKDDLLVGRFASSTTALIEVLANRPNEELVWTSLRVAFSTLAAHADAQPDRESTRRVHRAIFATPSLMSHYLYQIRVAELAARDILRDREEANRDHDETGTIGEFVSAVVAAAFACLVAAQTSWSELDDDTSMSVALDHAMAAVRPTRERI